jgi:hypothetical protein
MFHDAVDDPGAHTHEELYAEYQSMLVAAVESAGGERAAKADLDEGTVEALLAGEFPELTLEEGAALLALDDDAPDADTVVALARDALMMGLSNAVLDVEALSAGIDGEMEPRELQAKIEGRYPITLREFARIHQYIGTRTR